MSFMKKKDVICEELQKQVNIGQCDKLVKDKIIVHHILFSVFFLFLVRVTFGLTTTTTKGKFVGESDNNVGE